MESLLTTSEFEEEIQKIEHANLEPLVKCQQALTYCRSILELYRKEFKSQSNLDLESEIHFFKFQKQIPAAHLVYYHHLLNYELKAKNLGPDSKPEFIKRKVKKLERFFESHVQFLEYIEMEQDYQDEIYFTRKYNFKNSSCRDIYDRDPDFSTSHDFLLSRLIAAKKFLLFLLRRLNALSGISSPQEEPLPFIKWTSSKVALTELIYALHHSGAINNGNASLKDIVQNIEKIMNVDMGDYHHTFLRLRDRSQPMKFLDKLKNNLSEKMQEMDS